MKFDSYSFKIRQLNSNVNDMRNELKDLKHVSVNIIINKYTLYINLCNDLETRYYSTF